MIGAELAEGVALADTQQAFFTTEFHIVRRLSGRDKREKDIASAEFRRSFDYAMTGNLHLVVQNHLVADDGIRADGYIATEFGFGADNGCWMNRHWRFSRLSAQAKS